MSDRTILDTQIAYYSARASEYDEWFLRQGRYDRGPEHRAEWSREVAETQSALIPLIPRGKVLELACGTGLWTELLARHASSVVAVDASPETIALNAERVHSVNVQYIVADIFAWTSDETFDLIFFSFWLSHVPESRFDQFWERVRRLLNPGGRVFFVDSLLEQLHATVDHGPLDRSGIIRRRLNDGREFEIVKVFYEPADLERRLHDGGWQGEVHSSGRFFLFGSMTRGSSESGRSRFGVLSSRFVFKFVFWVRSSEFGVRSSNRTGNVSPEREPELEHERRTENTEA